MHKEKHFTSSDLIKDIVIGMSDGLTVPFALAAGLSGAVASNSIIITAGIAEVVAGSIAMGLGGYLAGRTEVDHYQTELARERLEVETMPEAERQEVRDVFGFYGISPGLQDQLALEL
ncbi:MAG: VIT1/CCC1 transporter family protein [Lentimicrobium sp.]|nr:VIT1/CCC1 transporter family protein [Lentimicrobium sp.]